MTDLFLATVYSVSSSGISLTIDGETGHTTKLYKRLASASLSAGDRVLVVKQAGTYIILGKIV